MYRPLLLICATALLIAPAHAQAQDGQSPNGMTIPEFRQVLVDLGSYLDAHKGSNIRSQFEALTDDSLRQLMPAMPNLRRFQTAVTALKQHDAARGAQSRSQRPEDANANSIVPLAAFPACTPNTIIDNSPGAQCTPAYPDPTNSAWKNMVNPIITFGAFSPSDYASVSSQACGLTVETNLVQVVAALNGTVTAAAIGCSAMQAVPLTGTIQAGVCDGAVATVAVAGAVSQGFLADCSEQDGLVNAAEVDAGFHNTVTIFNDLNTSVAGLNTHLTNVDSDINTHLTNVDNHIAAEFAALDAHLVMLFNQLTNQITQSTALSDAELKQVMKLELTPNGQKVIDPPILTCTGTNCPNVLAACAAAGCSWNNVGPLP